MKFELELGAFYSQGDERRFFEGLADIRGVTTVTGRNRNLLVQVNVGKLNTEAVFDLIALCRRYEIPLAPLAALAERKKLVWVSQAHWYWHHAMFDPQGAHRREGHHIGR